MLISNIQNSRGNSVSNQIILNDDNGDVYFQSYQSRIVKKSHGKIYLDINYWDYSVTTEKYRNIFLNETKKETERKIKDGTYILTDLNKREA